MRGDAARQLLFLTAARRRGAAAPPHACHMHTINQWWFPLSRRMCSVKQWRRPAEWNRQTRRGKVLVLLPAAAAGPGESRWFRWSSEASWRGSRRSRSLQWQRQSDFSIALHPVDIQADTLHSSSSPLYILRQCAIMTYFLCQYNCESIKKSIKYLFLYWIYYCHIYLN